MTPTRTSEQDQASSSPPELWYTVEGGARSGPWSFAQINERLAAGTITSGTLCWTDGMRDWAEFRTIGGGANDASTKISGAEAPSSNAGEAQPVGATEPAVSPRDDSPRPWRRWFARSIDTFVAAIVVGIGAGVFGYSFAAANDYVVGFFALMAQALLVEPLSFALGGRTVGKALLNISVKSEDLTTLDFSQAFRRATSVWAKGLAFGLPLVSLITTIHQYQELTRTGTATYDRDGRFRVTHGAISGERMALLTVCAAIFVVLWLMGLASK